MSPSCVSLFSGGGVGDIGVQYAGIEVLSCSEIVPERVKLLRQFFPKSLVHEGDIRKTKGEIVAHAKRALGDKRLFVVLMSPPCQGMSSNGAGRISKAVRDGKRSAVDDRNRLILPALDVVDELSPQFVVLENVSRIQHTRIMNDVGEEELVLDLIHRRLSSYRVQHSVVDASSYGVPQRRRRFILVACRRDDVTDELHPPPTHAVPQTLRDAVSHLPELDALNRTADDDDVFHHVPRWTEEQHFVMRHTPEGETAFDNMTCVRCAYRNEGKLTVTCVQCQALLPRPCVRSVADGQPRLTRAFRTSYRRMSYDAPASTITTTSGVISSDNKGHPTQHRVLSVREVLIVSSLVSSPVLQVPWHSLVECVLGSVSGRYIRDVAGESIPSRVMYCVMRHLLRLCEGDLDT